MRAILFTVGCTWVTTLLACTPAADHVSSQRVIGSVDRLTSAELSAYVADQQYVHSLVRPDVRVRLNYADPRQYNFAMARLKLAGKTAENSPYLFELIEARRRLQIAGGVKAGAVSEAVAAVGTANRQEMHYIEEASVGGGRAAGALATAAGPVAFGAASSTFPDGAPYTYVDITVSTTTGRAIAPLVYREEFDNPNGNPGANVTVSTSGDTNVSTIRRYVVESYKYEDPGDGNLVDSYTRTEVGAANPTFTGLLPTLAAPIITAPVESIVDGLLSVCMDRAWTNDCDYVLDTGALDRHRISMPLQGSVAVTSAHTFDPAKIQQVVDALNAGQTPPEAGLFKLILTNVGGGCDVTDGNTLLANMLQFWSRVTLSADKKVFSWDLTGTHIAFFDEDCRQVQDRAKLTARIPLPLITATGDQSLTSITISNDPDVIRPEARLLPISLTNSCLAEGTQIELGDGKLAAIEALHIGQAVFNPYARAEHALTIMDTAKGSELAPMVRIRDAAGHTLLMTEMHPIATADRGMVQARALRAGDVVQTQQGPSTLTEVSREAYSGQVYNLKVGTASQLASLDRDQSTVYANGFLVGDGQIQSKYEALAVKQGDHAAADRRSAPWQRDALLSDHHNK